MAVSVEDSTTICSNCDKIIPAQNVDLHVAYCSRNLDKCKSCGEMVRKIHSERHYLSTHAAVNCKLCGQTVEIGNLGMHKCANCPFRIVTCQRCNLRLPALDLQQHQEACANPPAMRRNYSAIRRGERFRRRELAHSPPSQRQLVFTVAVAGVATFLASVFFQRK